MPVANDAESLANDKDDFVKGLGVRIAYAEPVRIAPASPSASLPPVEAVQTPPVEQPTSAVARENARLATVYGPQPLPAAVEEAAKRAAARRASQLVTASHRIASRRVALSVPDELACRPGEAAAASAGDLVDRVFSELGV